MKKSCGFLALLMAAVLVAACPSPGADDCTYNGKQHALGESFPAADGCNLCTCGKDQSINCTTISCVSDAGSGTDAGRDSGRDAAYDAARDSGRADAAQDSGHDASAEAGRDATAAHDRGFDAALDSGTAGDTGAGSDGGATADPCTGFAENDVYRGSYSVEQLAQLAAVAGKRCVTGDLDIHASDIVSLDSLSQLEMVGGALRIQYMPGLLALPLDALRIVGGLFVIEELPAIATVGLSSLASVNDLYVSGNGTFTDLSLPSLVDANIVTIQLNSALASIKVPNLTTAGAVWIHHDNALINIAMPAVTELFRLTVTDNPYLDAVSFTSLHTVEETLEVGVNDGLLALSLPALTAAQIVTIYDHLALASLDLPQLTQTTGRIALTGNRALTSLNLPLLAAVGETFEIANNQLLATVALPVLVTVGTSISVVSNPSLLTLDLPQLQTAGGLFVQQQLQLTDFSFSQLRTIGGFFFVDNNHALAGFELPALVAVNLDLNIAGNAALTRLSLPALAAVGTRFRIADNPTLPDCIAKDLRAQVLAAGGIGGQDYISGNLDPCAGMPCPSCVEDCSQENDYACP